jgi:hypothetical protein
MMIMSIVLLDVVLEGDDDVVVVGIRDCRGG